MSAPRLRAARPEELAALLAVEQAAHRHPWSEAMFREEFQRPFGSIRVAVDDADQPVAHLVSWLLAGELEVLNVATHPSHRRQGLARRLLAEALAQPGLTRAVLEVRESNHAAQALYRGLGFVEVGRRAGYYEAENEDALVMACEQPAAPLSRS